MVPKGRITNSAVAKFIVDTSHLLQQMLESASTPIPWTELKKYEPMFAEVDARHLACQTDDITEDYFQGWDIASYKRPILLSCSHGKVKICKGKVCLVQPKHQAAVNGHS